MDYIIVIPSYKRPTILQNKTLTCLHNLGVPADKINIFIIEDEYVDYHNKLNRDYYNQLIIGKKGLVQQREFINTYYPANTKIISLDDDIDTIDLSLSKYTTIDEFFTDAFTECENRNCFIWSVYPVLNPFFRTSKKDIKEGLLYCIGAFYGYINRNDDDLELELTRVNGNKEDVERSIKYWLKDKKIIRFERVGFKTKYYGNDGGGLGTFKDRLELMKEATNKINNNYPSLTKIQIRKNGMYEIVFKKIKNN
jgi:hypothetical protein